jgi:hypothetical protein
VLIRYNYLIFFRRQKRVYVMVDLDKIGSLLEFTPGIKEKNMTNTRLSIFKHFFRQHTLRKKKLRHYVRLTRVLKKYIHKY